MNRNIHSYHT